MSNRVLMSKKEKEVAGKMIPASCSQDYEVIETPKSVPLFAVFSPFCLGYPSEYRFKFPRSGSGIALICDQCTILFQELKIKQRDFFLCNCERCEKDLDHG